MSLDNQSDTIRLLTSQGLSGEEAQVIADLRAKGPAESAAELRALEAGEWRSPAFWMAVGFLSLLTLGKVLQPAILFVILFVLTFSQVGRALLAVGSLAVFSIFSCGAVWLLAKGKLDSVTRRLACRYSRPGWLRSDLGIALLLLVVISDVVLPLLFQGLPAPTLGWTFGVQLLCYLAVSLLPFALSAYAVIRLFPATDRQLACQSETASVDVERQVERWRDRLRGREAVQEEDALELEEHLREEMATLITGGLSEREAFLIACRRIGPQEALEHEFALVNAAEIWRNRAYWVVVGGFSIISFRMLKGAAWAFLAPWVGSSWMYCLWDAPLWCLGFLLFLRLAHGHKMPLAHWLGRRHRSSSKLMADLVLCGVVLALVSIAANVAMYHSFETVALPCTDVPLLALACFGIALLHPTRKPHIAK